MRRQGSGIWCSDDSLAMDVTRCSGFIRKGPFRNTRAAWGVREDPPAPVNVCMSSF